MKEFMMNLKDVYKDYYSGVFKLFRSKEYWIVQAILMIITLLPFLVHAIVEGIKDAKEEKEKRENVRFEG